MKHFRLLVCLVLVFNISIPSKCAFRYSRHEQNEETQGFAWISPYAFAKFAILGASISWLSWKIYKYFVFSCDDAQQLCNSFELYVQDVHKRYERELKLIGNEDIITIKKDLKVLIIEQCGRLPYFSYANRLNKEIEQCKAHLNSFDKNVLRVHELICKIRDNLKNTTNSRKITDLENQFLQIDQIETRLYELKTTLIEYRQSFEKLHQFTIQFPEYEQDRFYMRVNKV